MGSSKVLESRGGHFRRTGVFLVAILLLLLQPGAAVPGGSESTHGRNVSDWKIESVLEQRRDAQPWQVWAGPFAGKHWGIGDGGGRCEESYGVVPCSKSLGGNVLLLVAFGFVLYKSAMLMSDGSDLLLTVTDPGIVGGLVLPILGALPDAWLIVVSGLGGSQAEAQEQVLVGMGLLAGSVVMMLTALWGSCLFVGRCDLVEQPTTSRLVAKDEMLTKGSHLTETGVTTNKVTKWASWIVMATLLPYLVAQAPRVLGCNTEGHLFIAIAAVLALLFLCCYCLLLSVVPRIQKMRIGWAKMRYRRNHFLHKLSFHTNEQNWGSVFTPEGKPNEEVLMRLFDHFDSDHDKFLTESELKGLLLGLGIERHNGQVPDEEELQHWMKEFDISGDGQISVDEFLEGTKRWMKISLDSYKKKKSASSSSNSLSPSEHHGWELEAQMRSARLDLAYLDSEDDDDEEDELSKDLPPSKDQIVMRGVLKVMAAMAVAFLSSNPFVDAIGGFSEASGISPFFVSFIVTPLACSSSEAISSIVFAGRQQKKTISFTYSQIYGAVTMKNTLCLGVFLAVVYFRHLVWDFSAEVVVIFSATLIMGSLTAVRTTFPLWMGFVGLALYPLSIALVAYLDYVCGWH